MTPRCSCVVCDGILLTREPLGEVFQGDCGWCLVTARQDLGGKEKKGSARVGLKYKWGWWWGDLRVF